MTTRNTAIAIVGKGQNFKIYEDDAVEPYLAAIDTAMVDGGDEKPAGDEPSAENGTAAIEGN